MALFHKGKEEKEESGYVCAKDRIHFEKLNDNDVEAKALIGLLKNGNPLVLNFGQLDIMAANKYLGFFTGATVALDGKFLKINETSYMFARQEDFADGTLNDFIQSLN